MRTAVFIFVEKKKEKFWLLKKGLGLILHSGLALIGLVVLRGEIESISSSNPIIAMALTAFNQAFTWFVPLVFAGIGVNVLSEALLRDWDE